MPLMSELNLDHLTKARKRALLAELLRERSGQPTSTRREARPNLVIGSILHAAGELAERLLAVAPPGLGHVVFTNSGAEAVEAAIKLARCRTGRSGVLSARNGFPGLTLARMSATGSEF